MDILSYFYENEEIINDKIKDCNSLSQQMLNSAYAKRELISKSPISNIGSIENNQDNQEKITDRDGSFIFSKCTPVNGGIESGNTIHDNAIIGAMCTINADANLSGENITNNSISSFNEYIYSDTLYDKKTLNDIDNTKSDISGFFYEVEITLPIAKKINYIDISSSSKFFQNIIYIKYSPTDMHYHRKNLVSTNNCKMRNNIFYCDETVCKKIYIGVVQSHYELVTKDDVSKFLYKININNIRAGFKLYHSKSFYQSNYISYKNSKVSLSANIHEDKDSSSEFYISFDKKEYIPILPLEIKICKERLFFTSSMATLRFKASSILSVKKDHVETEYKTKSNNGIFAILLDPAPGSIYTVEYIPVEQSYFVSGTTNVSLENEIIHCTDTNSYKLSKIPVSDNISIEIFDNIKSKMYKGEKITNITGNNNVWNSSKFSYSLNEDIVTFNKDLDDRYSVNISYRAQKEGLSIRVITRQNTRKSLCNKTVVKDVKII